MGFIIFISYLLGIKLLLKIILNNLLYKGRNKEIVVEMCLLSILLYLVVLLFLSFFMVFIIFLFFMVLLRIVLDILILVFDKKLLYFILGLLLFL